MTPPVIVWVTLLIVAAETGAGFWIVMFPVTPKPLSVEPSYVTPIDQSTVCESPLNMLFDVGVTSFVTDQWCRLGQCSIHHLA